MPLTTEQQAFVTAPRCPLTTLRALAGTGKSYVITERIQWLVSQGVLPKQIAVVCFSKDAVQELKRRLERYRLGAVRVSTLHRLCLGAQSKTLIGERDERYQRAFKPLKESVRWDNKRGATLENYLGFLQQTVLPGGAEGPPDARLQATDLRLIKGYWATLEQQSWTTLTGLLWQTLLRLRADPALAGQMLGDCQYLISDEYQDVSPLQHALFQELARGRHFTVVGDPSQSIYGFQGAAPSLLMGLERQANQSFTLSANFRCPAHLLVLANRTLALTLEEDDMDELLVPTRPPEGQLQVCRFTEPPYSLLALTLREILRELPTREPGQVAVLVRGNEVAQRLAQELLKAGVRIRLIQDEQGRTPDLHVQTGLLPLFQCVMAARGSEREQFHPLAKVLVPGGRETVTLSPDAQKLLQLAWDTRRSAQDVRHLASQWPQLVKELAPVLELWGAAEQSTEDPDDPLAAATRLASKFWPEWKGEKELRLESLLKGRRERAENISPIDIMTIHKAKGGEWNHVILWEERTRHAAGERDFWEEISNPPKRIFGYDTDLAEETRLRYVALTRSRQHLTAFIHEECSEGYTAAFDSGALARAGQVQRLFGCLPDRWLAEDVDFLRELMRGHCALQEYAAQFWPGHASPQALAAAASLLLAADLELPEAWASRVSGGFAVEPKPATRVRRVPLRKQVKAD